MYIDVQRFRAMIWDYYASHKRAMPWRNIDDPYGVVVSEIMLQQTQVPRVLIKYPEFIRSFPTFQALATASVKDVLTAWQGMGYNRRGQYLKRIAETVMKDHGGNLPKDPAVLVTFPGIGKATAGSIAAFAYNLPTVFIETNIRRVFIHTFFRDESDITDVDIQPLVAETLDLNNPREWYYALMDYGTALAKQVENPNRRSKHYAVQSRFEGSTRQMRGRILRMLLAETLDRKDIIEGLGGDAEKVGEVLDKLEAEHMLVRDKRKYSLPE